MTAADKRQWALVTGASSGIGRAFAERLATDGYDLILVARRRDRLDELAARLGTQNARAEVLPADLSDGEVLRTVEKRIAGERELALLVNNAGFGGYGPFVESDPDLAERQIALHATALVRLTRAALPGMVARGNGAIINVASMLAFSGPAKMPFLKRATYAGTKSFVVTFTQVLQHELEGTGVKVQALCPGLVRTEFHDKLGGRPSGLPVLEAADVVAASLAGLALDEVVCIPAMADPALLEAVNEAEQHLMGEVRSSTVAARYRGRSSG